MVFSLSDRRFKAAAMRFPSSTGRQKKLTELNPRGGSQAINTIIADIYGRQYSTMIEYGLQRCQ